MGILEREFMGEDLDSLMTMAEAARQKSCTRQTIYRAIQTGLLNIVRVAGRSFVVSDGKFRGMPLKKSSEPALKRSVAELKGQVEELQSSLKQIFERVVKLEKENVELKAWLKQKPSEKKKQVVGITKQVVKGKLGRG